MDSEAFDRLFILVILSNVGLMEFLARYLKLFPQFIIEASCRVQGL